MCNNIVADKERLINKAVPDGINPIKDCYMETGPSHQTLFLKSDPNKPIITFYGPEYENIVDEDGHGVKIRVSMDYKIHE